MSDEINNGNGVEGAATIVGDVGELAVIGSDDFVGVGAGTEVLANDLQGGRIDDGERLIAFAEDEKGGLRRFITERGAAHGEGRNGQENG